MDQVACASSFFSFMPPSSLLFIWFIRLVLFSFYTSKRELSNKFIPIFCVMVRQTALLGLSYSTVTKVVLLDMDQLGLQLVCDFGWMQITRTLIRFVRPYDDSMGLNTITDSVMTELSL
jgi:hypothetical protein